MARPLYEIANEIKADWAKPNFAAKPYIVAMYYLADIRDQYYMDSGVEIVARFLSNAGSWRGETAKRVKAELRALLKDAT